MAISEIEAHQVVDTVKAIAERGALDIAKRAHQTIDKYLDTPLHTAVKVRLNATLLVRLNPATLLKADQKLTMQG